MDLVASFGLIYLIGLVISPIVIRLVPKLNKYMHENIDTPNPAVFTTVLWPIVFAYIAIYYIYKLFTAIINWASGNGFITKSKNDHVTFSDYEY